MPDDVLAWLNSKRDYAAGLELLRKYGATNFLLNLLKDGPGQFNTVKLAVEVGKLKVAVAGGSSSEDKNVATAKTATTTATATQPYTPNHDMEKKLRINGMIRTLFKEIAHLHGKLAELPEGDELFQCARLVITKDLRKQDLFDQLHYFETNGKWFDELPENLQRDFDPTDAAQLEQKIKNLMASRAKARKELTRPLPVAMKEHHEKRVAEFTRLIDHYTSLRN